MQCEEGAEEDEKCLLHKGAFWVRWEGGEDNEGGEKGKWWIDFTIVLLYHFIDIGVMGCVWLIVSSPFGSSTIPVSVISAVVFPNPFDEVSLAEMESQTDAGGRVKFYALTGQLIYSKTFHAGVKKVYLTGKEIGL